MKKLRVAPLPEPATPDYTVEFSEDVACLVAVAGAAGYGVSPDVAARLWALYSEGLCASWLSVANWSDEAVLECLLKYAVIVDTDDGVPEVPDGYQSWLDYAVDAMTLPVSEFSTLNDVQREAATAALREAAREELDKLRRLAGRASS
ncbi:hypothetical protein [Denitromonas sp.]|uniref:hypothetical protein n=1 Tax=Denitromonas sp. TaxID=2734609 RepID=UPI002AFF08F6|nr:hypothetical protein [Denitromonas sp.]